MPISTERWNVYYLFYPFWSLHYHWKGLLKKPPQSELQIFCACEPVGLGLWGLRFLKFWKNRDQYITNMCWNEKKKSQKKIGYSESTQIWVDMKCPNSWKKKFYIEKNTKSQNGKISDQKKIGHSTSTQTRVDMKCPNSWKKNSNNPKCEKNTTLYNAILRIARNFLETTENIKISTHPFYHINLG